MMRAGTSFGAGLVVLGAGRGSAELIDLLADLPDAAQPREVVVVDDRALAGPVDAVCGVPVVGGLDRVAGYVGRGFVVVSGIAGAGAKDAAGKRKLGVRNAIAARLALPREAWATVVHPAAVVSRRAKVGVGVVAYPGAQVHVDAVVGDHVLLYPNAVVHHDVVVDAGAILCAGVICAGHVRVGAGSYLGVGTAVRERVAIGAEALCGMGSVVVADVDAGATVVGVPARAR
jgi:sugar O-acyltransferase (sialic acid O-acetyltransferase NeuD family)